MNNLENRKTRIYALNSSVPKTPIQYKKARATANISITKLTIL